MKKLFNQFRAKNTFQIVLYHANFRIAPALINGGLHNVSPAVTYSQLKWLKNNFHLVYTDDMFKHNLDKGYASITFDDGYLSYNEFIHEIVEELEIPVTIFLNGGMVEGNFFWRDKIRFLIASHLCDQFIEFTKCSNYSYLFHNMNQQNFYSFTKSYKLSSKIVSNLIDSFLLESSIDLPNFSEIYLSKQDLIYDSNFVKYGNHSYNHYVLSSLSKDEQLEEISKNHTFLNELNVAKSDVFSIPFGGKNDFNVSTLEILESLGYRYALTSHFGINSKTSIDKLFLRDRFMPPDTYSRFQSNIFKLNLKDILGR